MTFAAFADNISWLTMVTVKPGVPFPSTLQYSKQHCNVGGDIDGNEHPVNLETINSFI